MKIYDRYVFGLIPVPSDNPPADHIELVPDVATGGFMMLKSDGTKKLLGAIQPDWNQADTSKDDYIKNKPAIGSGFGNTIIVHDQKPSGTDGGTATYGAWRTRDLNTINVNTLPGATLVNNQLTLPAGQYRVSGYAMAYRCNRHKARLFNITQNVTMAYGSSMYLPSTSSSNSEPSHIFAQFTLTVQSVLELQHRVESTRTDTGFGLATGFGEPEIYAELEFIKIS